MGGEREERDEGGEVGERVNANEGGCGEEEWGGLWEEETELIVLRGEREEPPYVWPCLGLLRKESGSKCRGTEREGLGTEPVCVDGGAIKDGEGEEGRSIALGLSVIMRSVNSSPPITGLGRRVRESVATP